MGRNVEGISIIFGREEFTYEMVVLLASKKEIELSNDIDQREKDHSLIFNLNLH